ncbi:MAG TPA: MFS transporter [Streptosporangiaceae bacterium]|nr:MFS transporter [Streptosporangiaceae bacterium]
MTAETDANARAEIAGPEPAAEHGLWSAPRRALTVGLVLTITFIATEALAVVTIMPVVARDLHGLDLYGWVFSAFMLGDIIGIVAAGRQADRYGPARPFIAGVVLFGTGLAIAGLAPSMLVLVAGRALQGIGAGAVPAVAYVAIGRSLPERLRARMMAVLSTAWVLPGLAGPAISAAVASVLGWRWVFLGLLPLVAVTASMAMPALLRLGQRPAASAGSASAGPASRGADEATGSAPAGTEHRIGHGLAAAAGAGLILAGLTLAAGGHLLLAGLGVVAVGATVLGLALRQLLPAGTFSARRGLPAVILCRGLLTFAFFGADAYVTLTITTIRHHTPVFAGLAVTGATLSWTAGAWVQSRLNGIWEARRLIRSGLAFIVTGLAAMALVLLPATPVTVGLAAWTVAGFGMGMAYAPLSLLMLRAAPTGREGWASASLSLSDVLGTAIGIGIGGAAVTAANAHGWPLASGVAVAFAVAGLGAAVLAVASRRLPLVLTGMAPAPSQPVPE